MNKMKRIMSLLLAVLMLLTTSVVGTATENSDKTNEALNLLNILGIVDYTALSDEIVTRAEFTGMMVKALGYTDEKLDIFDGEAFFTDIAEESKYFSLVGRAAKLGLVSGYENGRFYPDGKMKTVYAVNMAVKAICGNYYLQLGDSYYSGIAKGINCGENLDRRNAVRLIMNMLESGIIKYTSIDNAVISDETLLEDVFSIHKINGIVNSTDIINLYGKPLMQEGYVLIGDYICYNEEFSMYNYIGYNVNAYVRLINDEYKLVSFSVAGKNNATCVKAEDISDTTTIKQFVYEDDGRQRTVDITVADVIYNNELVTDYTKDDLQPQKGTVTIVDNNGDSKIDVVIIKSYVNAVVSSASPMLEKVNLMYGQQALNMSDDKYIIVDEYGDEVPYLMLEEYDVLSIYSPKSQDCKKIFIELSEKEPVTGIVTGFGTSDGKTTARIDGEEYIVDSDYITYSTNNPTIVPVIKIGLKSTFYLSSDNEIAAVSDDITDGKIYGYMTKMKYDDEEERLYVTIFTGASGLVKYEITDEKIRFNGEKKTLKEIYDNGDLFGIYDGSRKFIPQMVKFDLKNSQIKGIDFASLDKNKSFVRTDMLQVTARTTPLILDDWMVSGTKFYYDSNTMFFSVPQFIGEDIEEDDIKTLQWTQVASDTTYSMELYGLNAKTNYVECGVIIGTVSDDWRTGPTVVVTEVCETLTEDEEAVIAITGYNKNGETKSYYVTSDKNYVDMCNVKAGDIVSIITNKDNKVVRFRKLFTLTKRTDDSIDPLSGSLRGHTAYAGEYTSQSGMYDTEFNSWDFTQLHTYYGKAIDKTDLHIVMETYKKNSDETIGEKITYPITTRWQVPVMVVDYRNPRRVTVSAGSYDDISESGSEIFVVAEHYNPTMIYVINR